MDVWGVGTRSLPYTLWQLLWRPGCLIRDYISGKRQVSFPPVKMLVLVAVVLYFVGRWFFSEFWEFVIEPKTEASTEVGMLYYLETMTNWLSTHVEWAFLAIFSLFIVPTWYVFRYAPDFARHTLPQGFFIQVFVTVQFLIWIFIGSLVLKLFRVSDVDAVTPALIFSTVFFVLLIEYHQLFGYGWWGTTWRIISIVVSIVVLLYFTALPLVLTDYALMGEEIHWRAVVVRTIGMAVLSLIFFVAVYAINRRLWKQGIKRRKHVILFIAAFGVMIILIDASLNFKFSSSALRFFKTVTETALND